MSVKVIERKNHYCIYIPILGECFEEFPKIVLNSEELAQLKNILNNINRKEQPWEVILHHLMYLCNKLFTIYWQAKNMRYDKRVDNKESERQDDINKRTTN